MKKLIAATIVLIAFNASAAFLKHSYVSGMNRICVYDDLGSQVVITIPSTQLCPLSI